MPNNGKPLVFVVDDEPLIAQTAAQILSNEGFDARAFTDPLAALVAARKESPNLLLTDVIMPGLNGFELSSWIVANCPQCKVLLFTADPNAGKTYATSTADSSLEVLSKPIRPETLLIAIRNKLDS